MASRSRSTPFFTLAALVSVGGWACDGPGPSVALGGCEDVEVGETIDLSVSVRGLPQWTVQAYPGWPGDADLVVASNNVSAQLTGTEAGRVIVRVYASAGLVVVHDECIITIGAGAPDAGVEDAGGSDAGTPEGCVAAPMAAWQDSAFTSGWTFDVVGEMSFGDYSWSAEVVPGGCSPPDTAVQATLQTSASGGAGAAVWVLGTRADATAAVDPLAGGRPVCGIRMAIEGSDEALPLATQKTAVSVALVQGETIYWTKVFAVDGQACMRKADWTEESFVRFAGPGPARPDLVSGAPLSFGFLVGQSRSQDGVGGANPHLVDGWQVELFAYPEPP